MEDFHFKRQTTQLTHEHCGLDLIKHETHTKKKIAPFNHGWIVLYWSFLQYFFLTFFSYKMNFILVNLYL